VATVVSVENVKDVRALLRTLDARVVPQRQRLFADVLSVSLRLGPILAATLASSLGLRQRLRHELAARRLEVVTLDTGPDAIPPDGSWRTWWMHTLDLARVLVDLLPDDSHHGSVSTTLPRSAAALAAAPATPAPAEPTTGEEAAQRAADREHELHELREREWQAATRLMADLSGGLTEIAWHTGRLVRVAVEAAPQTLITGSKDIVRLLERADPARIGACLSAARLAEAAESPAQALTRLRRARLSVVKLRLGGHADPELAATGRTMLAAVLGGVHAECDHLEVEGAEELDAARDELGAVGLDGAADRPMPGVGRAV
jgi:sugar phosphate isomerase/epimerase